MAPSQRSVPREGVWFARPQRVRWGLRKLPAFLFAVWMPFQLTVWTYSILGRRMPRWLLDLFAGWAVLFVAVALLRWAWEATARMRRPADARFSDRLPGLREFPMEIIVSENGRPLGMDRGVAWFDDGLLNFSGAATSFVITGADVIARDSALGKDAYEKLAKDEILLDRPGLFSTVRLMPLMGLHRYAYRRARRRFLDERKPSLRSRQWPPAAAYGKSPAPRLMLEGSPESLGAEAARTGSSKGVVRSRL